MKLLGPLTLLVGCAGAPSDPDDGAPRDTDVPTPPSGARALTAAELRRTIDAVFEAPLADDLWWPPDGLVHGFSGQLDGAGMTSARLAAIDRAVEVVLDRALRPAPQRETLDAASADGAPLVHESQVGGQLVTTAVGWAGRIDLPSSGRYRLDLVADIADRSSILTALLGIDGRQAAVVTWADRDATSASVEAELTAGMHEVAIWQHDLDEGLTFFDSLTTIRFTGPLDPPPAHAAPDLVDCATLDEAACLARTVDALVPLLWRRPIDDEDRAALLAVADRTRAAGGTAEDARVDALHAALLDPRFVLHMEGGDAWGLAARLSYALWSGPPDAALRARAEAGDLADPTVLAGEVRRMLADPRASALVDVFAAEWFELPRLAGLAPSTDAFPGWTSEVGAAMDAQVRAFVRAWLFGGDLTTLVTQPTTEVDPVLARWIGAPSGAAVDVGALGRPGILGLPGVQVMLSHPATTSPSRRGAWILDRLLCADPGTPPATVPALPATEADRALPIAQRLERHANDPACSGCHRVMDPLGLAMESFDPVGQRRIVDRDGVIVDDQGVLADGTTLDGLAELAAWVAADPRYPACIVEKVFTWMVGRPPAREEAPRMDAIQQGWERGGRTLEALAVAIATDGAFLAPPTPPEEAP